MNAGCYYRYVEKRSGKVWIPNQPHKQSMCLRRPVMAHRRTFRVGDLVLLLMWDDGVFA